MVVKILINKTTLLSRLFSHMFKGIMVNSQTFQSIFPQIGQNFLTNINSLYNLRFFIFKELNIKFLFLNLLQKGWIFHFFTGNTSFIIQVYTIKIEQIILFQIFHQLNTVLLIHSSLLNSVNSKLMIQINKLSILMQNLKYRLKLIRILIKINQFH